MKRILLFLALLLLAPLTRAQTISRIQTPGNANASVETINVTVTSTTLGDLITVFGSTGGNSVSTFTITDNKGNVYTPVSGYANVDLSGGTHSETDWFGWTIDAFGAVTTVTVAHNAAGSSTFGSVGVYRSTTGWPVNPVDKIVTGSYATSATSFTSGATATLSQSSEVAIGFIQFTFDPGSITPGGGFTARNTSAFLDSREHYFTDQIVSSTTALTLSATTGNSVDASAHVVTFKDNPGGGGGGSTTTVQTPGPRQSPGPLQTPGTRQSPATTQTPVH